MEFDLTAMIALTINAKMPLTIIKESMAALSPELTMKMSNMIILLLQLVDINESTHIILLRLSIRCNRLSILGSRRYSTKQVQSK